MGFCSDKKKYRDDLEIIFTIQMPFSKYMYRNSTKSSHAVPADQWVNARKT